MGVRLLFLIIWFCFSFFWAGAQSGNPFELLNGNRDSISVISNDTIAIDTNNIIDTIVENQEIIAEIPATTAEIVTNPEAQLDTMNQLVNIQSNPFELKMGSNVTGPLSSEERSEGTLEPEMDTTNSQSVFQDSIGETNPTTQTVQENTIEQILLDEKPIPESRNTFVFWISLLSGLLLSILFTGNRKILNEMMKSLSNINYMKLFQKEERNGGSISFFILYVIYVLNAAIFLRFVLIQFEVPLFNYKLIYLIGIVAGMVVLRHLSLSVVSYLRKRLPDAISYSFIIIIINSLMGLILIPINLMLAFGPNNLVKNIVFLGLFLLVLAFILKWFRGFVNSARIILGDSFHFLLYLCTCEIVPIFICIGFLRNLIN